MTNRIPFTDPPRWLTGALDIERSEVPSELEGTIRGVVDILQGGWNRVIRNPGGADFGMQSQRQSHAASSAAADVTAIVARQDRVGLFLGLALEHSGGAGALNITIDIVEPGGLFTVAWFQGNVGSGVTIPWPTFANGAPYLVLPPHWSLRCRWPATGVGESLHLTSVRLDVPLGVKPF